MKRLPNAPRGNIFSSVEALRTPQSRHNLSYVTKVSMAMGEIVPFWYEEVSPGYNLMNSAAIFGRMMPTITPIMQDINVEVRYFFVPYRLVWSNFEDFATGVGDHEWPCVKFGANDSIVPGSLPDYFGCGVEMTVGKDYAPLVDELPYRAYNLIWNEYFRDENIQNEIDINKDDDGTESQVSIDELVTLKCDWKKDYFTSALPWTQRGNMAQFIGDVFLKPEKGKYGVWVGANSHIVSNYGVNPNQSTSPEITRFISSFKSGDAQGATAIATALTDEQSFLVGSGGNVGPFTYDPNGSLGVAFGINQLRMANAIQRFFERSALVGNRYSEYILGMYGVKCQDSRLQRPEYLGGGVMPFQVIEVLQNEQGQLDSSGDPYTGSTPQGNVAGIGKVNGIFGFNKPYFFPEDGIAIGVMYIRPKANYINGTRKDTLVGVEYRGQGGGTYIKDRFERLYNPFFEHIGEEAVFGYELYSGADAIDKYGGFISGRDSTNAAVFGYQSRNAHKKFRNNEVHGEFLTTLKYWHLGREFSQTPELNSSFLTCNPSTRIFAVEDASNKFIFDIYNKVDAVLPMSAYSIPAL